VDSAIDQNDRPTVLSTVVWSVLGLALAAATSYATVARGTELVEVCGRLHQPETAGAGPDRAVRPAQDLRSVSPMWTLSQSWRETSSG
jgi:hypothetical protein